MIKYKNIKILSLLLVTMASCTKLDESLNSRLTNGQTANALGSAGVGLLLQGAYADLGGPFTAQDLLFCLEENVTDEALVPTRGGDWDDNGVWRVLHNHTWNADHAYVLNVFNALNKLNFDATNVLGFSPSPSQAAQAKFLRAIALYYLLDLYGQYPVRNPGDNLLNAPTVKTGAAASQFIIDELTAAIPNLPTTGGAGVATKNAGNTLLMKCYLNRGAWNNRATPTFADADMQQVITIGNSIISSGNYSYMNEYFKNFDVNNGASTENIFTIINNSGSSSNVSDVRGEWCRTLHYNQETSTNPNAGWNGFTTISDFYNSFGAVTPMVGVTNYATDKSGRYADTAVDSRVGGRYYPGVTNASGQRPGFMIGQQYNENGVALKDRKTPANNLAFDPAIANDMKETGNNLEITGIRVEKYGPDFSNGSTYYQNNAGNDEVIFRYADVVLMVAEAKLRAAAPDAAGALALVNGLRVARKAAPLVGPLVLANAANVEDPKTLLAERGRELYWEKVRRTDLIRFGMFLKTWQYKPTDDPKYLVFPVPSQALAANPNLVQNPGY
ncbi:RagB/SusD family nutrient uptake outer membrane protein [Ferruginibacter profundus]